MTDIWDLKPLQHFQVIYDFCSISHAANELGMTQSALTKSLQKLETKLAMPLFHRHTRELSPTEAGKQLYDQAQHLLAIHNAFNQQALQIKHGLTGQVSLGMGPFVQPLLAEWIVEEVMKRYPALRLTIHTDDFNGLSQSLLRHELDCVLYDAGDINQIQDPKRFKTQPLLNVPVVFVAHSQHAVFTQGLSPFKAQWALPKIPKRFITQLPESLQQDFLQAGIPQYQLQDMHHCLKLAKAGHVITATTKHIVKDALKDGSLKLIKLPFDVQSKIALYQLRTRQPSEACAQLMQCIERVCKQGFSKGQQLI